MALKPMMLTKTTPLTLYRKTAGGYVNGYWVDGTETEVVVDANVQPAKPSETLTMPESLRSKSWVKVYSKSSLRAAQEGSGGHAADEFDWLGMRYRVFKIREYAMGVQDHCHAIAHSLNVTAEGS